MNTLADLKNYRDMFTARELDRIEQQYVDEGAAYFCVSGAGHEASGCLAHWLSPQDWIRCHYRDKALMIARGLPVEEFFRALFCKETSSSKGRQMPAHLASKDLKLLSIPGPMGNNVLQDVGIAMSLKERKSDALIVSSFGEGTTQQGEVLEGFCEAARSDLPLLFLVHDNKYAISVRTTGKTIFFENSPSTLGITTSFVDGADAIACARVFEQSVGAIRQTSKPRIVVMECERLCSHTNADDQTAYRSAAEIARGKEKDPLLWLRDYLKNNGMSEAELLELEAEIKTRVKIAAERVLGEPSGSPVTALEPKLGRAPSTTLDGETEEKREVYLVSALNLVLDRYLGKCDQISLYGQDIEDPKGDVFGVTKGLSSKYPGRVQNAPLAESTIVGSCIGRALAGQKPVAFIQFADFLPLAFNQIINELATMSWRTAGAFTCPVVIIASAGGYRPGLGPFHAQTMEAYLCHTPGVVVVCPSNARDAAGLLISALESKDPVVFLYPKSLLNDPRGARRFDRTIESVPIGKGCVVQCGDAITLVGWGNIAPLLKEVAETLAAIGLAAEIIDLRSLSPWDRELVTKSAKKTGRLIVAHEDNESCGLGAEIVSTVAQVAGGTVSVARVCRPDVPVPCCFSAQLATLPSHVSILEAACEMLDVDLAWDYPEVVENDLFEVMAIGTSPADSQLLLAEWHVKEGQTIKEGDLLVEIEADKAAFEFLSPATGTLVEILVPSSSKCSVGDVIARVALEPGIRGARGAVPELLKRVPRMIRRKSSDDLTSPGRQKRMHRSYIYSIKAGAGTRRIDNEALAGSAGLEADEIFRATGIRTRYWFASEQEMERTIIDAADKMLNNLQGVAGRIGLVIVSTGTNSQSMPSRACRILEGLSQRHQFNDPGAYDFYTACSGYIYGLEQADGYLQRNPDRAVILITAEMLSRFLDRNDGTTAILFGDGFSISLIGGDMMQEWKQPVLEILSTCCHAKPDTQESLALSQGETITMDGARIFLDASRAMPEALRMACEKIGSDLDSLDMILPHQANERIIAAISRRLRKHGVDVFSNVERFGNTSSTTIPLCLVDVLAADQDLRCRRFGLTAFGGGYTYAGAILERPTDDS